MADARSPLSHLDGAALIERGKVCLTENPDVGKVKLRAEPDDAAMHVAIRDVVKLDLPRTPNTSTETPPLSALWLAPDEWMLVCASGSETDVITSLEYATLDFHASVVDVTDAYTILRLSGASARELLAKGCSLDLHQRAFALGDVAQTMLAKVSIILHQTADDVDEAGPVFDIYVPRSFADYLWAWFDDAIG